MSNPSRFCFDPSDFTVMPPNEANPVKIADDADDSTDDLEFDHAESLDYLLSVADTLGLADAYLDGSISPADRLRLCHEVGEVASAELRTEAESLVSALGSVPFADLATFGVKDKIGKFFGKAMNIVKKASLAAALTLMGPAEMNVDERQAFAQQVVVQQAYIRNFQQDVVSGAQPPDGTLPARAEQYGAATWLTAQNTVRAVLDLPDSPVTEERRVLAPADHCSVCPVEAAKGWQEYGTLRSIGDSPCRVQCRCHFEYKDADGNPFAFAPDVTAQR